MERFPGHAAGIACKWSQCCQTGFTSGGHCCAPQAARTTKEVLMGTVVIRCPATGITLPTGIRADRLKFACSPVFFADTYCPACETEHRWFAREAWVEE